MNEKEYSLIKRFVNHNLKNFKKYSCVSIILQYQMKAKSTGLDDYEKDKDKFTKSKINMKAETVK